MLLILVFIDSKSRISRCPTPTGLQDSLTPQSSAPLHLALLHLATASNPLLAGPRHIDIYTNPPVAHRFEIMAFAYSSVFALPPRSPVRALPSASVAKMAFSTLSA